MNRKRQNPALLRDTGKTLKLNTGLKAGGIKGESN
jgi:hypothetical protein